MIYTQHSSRGSRILPGVPRGTRATPPGDRAQAGRAVEVSVFIVRAFVKLRQSFIPVLDRMSEQTPTFLVGTTLSPRS
jgi:hypothetical protein